MQRVTWPLSLLLLLATSALAQDDGGGSQFFRDRRVAFWGSPKSEGIKASSPPGVGESLWAEPIRMPDGRISVYVPPRPVLEFLDSPSEESGLAYLAWQKARMEKIARASEILSRLAQETRPEPKGAPQVPVVRSAEPSDKAAVSQTPKKAANTAAELLYFKKDGCPHCRRQDATLAELSKDRRDIKLRVITPDQEEALWDALEIKIVPTIVIRGKDGRLHVARGYTPKEVLLEKLGAPLGGESK